MLNICVETVAHGCVEFKCPNCGGGDAIYMAQPKFCYRCHALYNFDVEKLIDYKSERISYHYRMKK